jgi:hypothetical protein
MSQDYEFSAYIPQIVDVESSEHESRELKAVFNQKILEDVREVLQTISSWNKVTADSYEREITSEVKLRIRIDQQKSLVFMDRLVTSSVLETVTTQERARQMQLLKEIAPQCNQTANEVFDRAYVRAIERATHQIGDVQMEQQYDRVNCVNSVRVMIRLTA